MAGGQPGTSPVIHINKAEFHKLTGFSLATTYDSTIPAQPPLPNGDEPSGAMTRFQNLFPEFVFDKISPPEYRTTLSCRVGIPTNKPDYVADYHVIGLMRCIDYMLSSGYNGLINGNYNTPNPK